ncbi:MAG: hypothetical protein KGV59_02740 [Tenacibaculum sp.]|nr:hypothetical protein [Tenacibaculum sp.]
MNIEKKNNYTLITTNNNSFDDFLSSFKEKHTEIENKNIIIQISDKLNVIGKDIFVLLEHAKVHQQNGTTFVVVLKNVDVDEFPETFNIVPTLQEAEDVLEMEEIQRDLGF